MAPASDLPCDGDGICMICNNQPPSEETLTCKTCVTPWHVTCLSSRPENLADTLQWECPDCFMLNPSLTGGSKSQRGSGGLIAAIQAIQSDGSLSELEKAKRRQLLLSGGAPSSEGEDVNSDKKRLNDDDDTLHDRLNCSFCMHLPDRPVTTTCGHNFCLKCFQRWINQGKRTCANCRYPISSKMASNPRINSALVIAIRMAKMSKSSTAGGPPKVYHSVDNENKPDKAYTTERAKKAGKANACSGKIFVTIPFDHFGPIPAENDPVRKQGVLVGELWEDRLECRQWGAHLPHVAGIAGQSAYGAQSVALSGGYVEDEDHGEWFLYTGSGGRDLSGNKRTNKEQSFDQKFEKSNEALRVSCRKGYPVRVVRSHKEKRSSYAPEKGVRYDGIYRIEKCWRKNGVQGYKVCRYLFVRCDNEPAPWTSDDHGDRPRPLPVIGELDNAIDVTERRGSPSWDYDEQKGCWMWKKPPPCSRKQDDGGNPEDGKKTRKVKQQGQDMPARENFPKGLSCQICWKVMTNPITTPCGHNFCKACLEGTFAGKSLMRQRTCQGGRTLRTQKNVMKCPSCVNDIAEYLQNPQVNRELMGMIELLQRRESEFENFDDSTEESDDACETIDAVADTKICNVVSETQEEAKDNILSPQRETKALQMYKPEQESSGNDESNVAGQEEGKLLEQPDNVAECKEQPTIAEVKRNYRRKKTSDEGSHSLVDLGVKTRNKKAKMTVNNEESQ
ncbi:hypothetical protein JCGZ_23093 [Jatropha curcas]|uniref:RING-type E3 ubiquitin transferase n=1 Tax=Jatropha curcas TaxID=180498 RepID=A0A067JTF1_JATCU|nr:E3 ubiquitin-protein ligase ORTHRUS 2 [Jatropha curcas]KDP23260.1 hypothetical protein JCGZ_23093 [Jatropha curcas]